jgi:hypothetical protein
MSLLWECVGRRVCACLLPLALASGCSRGDDTRGARGQAPVTIVVDGETVDVRLLREAVAGLCQARQEAATDARAAKATYDRRSKHGVATVARVLGRSYALLASSIAGAVERAEAGLAADPATASVTEELAHSAELLREGVARLGITTAACDR